MSKRTGEIASAQLRFANSQPIGTTRRKKKFTRRERVGNVDIDIHSATDNINRVDTDPLIDQVAPRSSYRFLDDERNDKVKYTHAFKYRYLSHRLQFKHGNNSKISKQIARNHRINDTLHHDTLETLASQHVSD